MKILQINSVCGFGSTGRIAVDLYRAAEAAGHDCKIAYGRGDAPADIDTIKIGGPLDVNLHGALSRLTDKHGFYSKKATRAFIEQAAAWKPDLVHLHNIHGYYLNIELLFHWLKDTGLPVVWTLHDCWAFTGHCAYFDYAGCKKWQEGCHACPQLREYPASMKDNSAWNYQKKKELFTSLEHLAIATPSEWLAGVVRESFLGKYPIRSIPNGIDLAAFHPVQGDFRKKYQLESKKLALGVASVWERRKGLEDFIKLRGLLDDSWSIVLVGLTQEQIDKLPAGIIGIARTNSVQELAELYSTADVYVNPSVEETMGLTTVEALACGTGAVVYDATAVPECVDDSCGIVVAKGDLKALAEAVQTADFAPEACITRARKYDKQEKYQEYLNYYHELVGEK